jgi:hypothetical protein
MRIDDSISGLSMANAANTRVEPVQTQRLEVNGMRDQGRNHQHHGSQRDRQPFEYTLHAAPFPSS